MRPQPADGFAWIDTPNGPALVCRALEPVARHIFTTRQWALGTPSSSDAERRLAWNELAGSLDTDLDKLARLHQVHGTTVAVRRPGDSVPGEPPDADIIVSDNGGLTLAIQTADCLPILIADRSTGAVAAVHAGWRGLAARAPQVAVRALAETMGSRPRDLVAAVGPSISASRYEVGADVRAQFQASAFGSELLSRWFPVSTRPGHWLFDGWRSAREQLADAGLSAAQIHVAELCTATYPDLFCSYRRDGMKAGRLAAAIRPI